MSRCGLEGLLIAVIYFVVGGLIIMMHFLGVFIFIYFVDGNVFVLEMNILRSWIINLDVVFYFDWVSVFFFRVVMLIGGLVIIYINFYIGVFLKFWRFFWMVFLFVFSMVLLIFRPNFFSVILGWDGLGITSFLLVVYYDDLTSYFSGVIVYLNNRFGDVLLLISMYIFMMCGDLEGFFLVENFGGLVFLIYLVIFFTKRAQFPFMVWLPMAMAAPTPVSALVHSSTLVTAGVYLVNRFYYFLMDYNLYMVVVVLSLGTFLISGLIALGDFDLKRVIAYSTLSQLGMIIFIRGMGLWKLRYFLMVLHAFYKSLFFMVFGVCMREKFGVQDGRFMMMGGGIRLIVMVLMGVSRLSLMGFPFLAGFYVKDFFFGWLVLKDVRILIMLGFYLGCIFTVMYRLKILKIIFYRWFGGLFFEYFEFRWVLIILIYLSFYRLYFGGFLVDLIFLEGWVVLYYFLKIMPFILLWVSMFFINVFMGLTFFFWNFFRSFYNLYYFVYDFWWNFSLKLNILILFDIGWLEYFGRGIFFRGGLKFSNNLFDWLKDGVGIRLVILFLFIVLSYILI